MIKYIKKITWYNAILFIPGMIIGLCILAILKCIEALFDGVYYILEHRYV